MRKFAVMVAGAAGLVGLVSAGMLGGLVPATAGAAAPKSGPEKVWVTPSPTGTTSAKHPGKAMFTGSFADYGRSVSSNANGKPTKKGTYALLTMKKGTILVNLTQFNAAFKTAQPQTYNKTTCSADIHVAAPVTIVKGTKAYAGIGGTFNMTASFAFIGPLKNGTCTTKTSTPALSTYISVTGSGTVTFSS
jgi:hypothetical protein